MSESNSNSNPRFSNLVSGAFILGCVALIIGLLMLTSRPHLDHAVKSPSNECINNLRLIDMAKQDWASDTHHGTNDVPSVEDLTPYLNHGEFPKCPAGGTYTIGKVGEPPTCSLGTNVVPAHVLP
jgi:hypothetical protein